MSKGLNPKSLVSADEIAAIGMEASLLGPVAIIASGIAYYEMNQLEEEEQRRIEGHRNRLSRGEAIRNQFERVQAQAELTNQHIRQKKAREKAEKFEQDVHERADQTREVNRWARKSKKRKLQKGVSPQQDAEIERRITAGESLDVPYTPEPVSEAGGAYDRKAELPEDPEDWSKEKWDIWSKTHPVKDQTPTQKEDWLKYKEWEQAQKLKPEYDKAMIEQKRTDRQAARKRAFERVNPLASKKYNISDSTAAERRAGDKKWWRDETLKMRGILGQKARKVRAAKKKGKESASSAAEDAFNQAVFGQSDTAVFNLDRDNLLRAAKRRFAKERKGPTSKKGWENLAYEDPEISSMIGNIATMDPHDPSFWEQIREDPRGAVEEVSAHAYRTSQQEMDPPKKRAKLPDFHGYQLHQDDMSSVEEDFKLWQRDQDKLQAEEVGRNVRKAMGFATTRERKPQTFKEWETERSLHRFFEKHPEALTKDLNDPFFKDLMDKEMTSKAKGGQQSMQQRMQNYLDSQAKPSPEAPAAQPSAPEAPALRPTSPAPEAPALRPTSPIPPADVSAPPLPLPSPSTTPKEDKARTERYSLLPAAVAPPPPSDRTVQPKEHGYDKSLETYKAPEERAESMLQKQEVPDQAPSTPSTADQLRQPPIRLSDGKWFYPSAMSTTTNQRGLVQASKVNYRRSL